MTKETKIGLLVGLTFIILFAIILSKKGPGNTQAPMSFSVADSGAHDGATPLNGVKPLDRAGKFPVERELPAAVQPEVSNPANVVMLEEPVGQEIPGEGEPIRPLPESVISQLNMAMIEVPVSTEGDGVDPEDAAMDPVTDAVVSALNGTPMSTGGSQASTSPLLSPNTDVSTTPGATPKNPAGGVPAMAMGSNRSIPAENPAALTSPAERTPIAAKPMTIVAIHEVQAGESLGKIAAKHYGRATPARIEAIFNANRDQLESVDSVKARTKLNIPLMEGEYASQFEPVNRLSPPPIGGRTAGSRSEQAVAAGTSRLDAGNPSRRDSTVRIPIPVDERATSGTVRNTETSRVAQSPTSGVREESRTRPPEPTVQFSWYEVREKDTLSKIARNQLGSEARYRDIFKLNHDIIPDVHKLKPGMKIRIPVKSEPARSSAFARESLAADPNFDQ